MTRSFAVVRLSCALALCVALLACSRPKVPEQDAPPSPQSSAAAPASAAAQSPTTLTEAIHRPIDDAKATRQATEDAAVEQRRAIDAATGE